MFEISAGIFFFGNLIYVLFGKAEVQSWNDLSKIKQIQTKDNSDKP